MFTEDSDMTGKELDLTVLRTLHSIERADWLRESSADLSLSLYFSRALCTLSSHEVLCQAKNIF